jgi:hypothetical protein
MPEIISTPALRVGEVGYRNALTNRSETIALCLDEIKKFWYLPATPATLWLEGSERRLPGSYPFRLACIGETCYWRFGRQDWEGFLCDKGLRRLYARLGITPDTQKTVHVRLRHRED